MVKSKPERASVPNYHHMMAFVIHGSNASTQTVQINVIIIISDPVFHPDSVITRPARLRHVRKAQLLQNKKVVQATSEGK